MPWIFEDSQVGPIISIIYNYSIEALLQLNCTYLTYTSGYGSDINY